MNELTIGVISGVSGAIITGLITFLITKFSIIKKYTSKKLHCTKFGTHSLLNFSKKIKDDLRISYKGEESESISLLQLRFDNVGYEAIENQPIIIKYEDGVIIKDFYITTNPEIGFGSIQANPEDNIFKMDIELLNPNDSITVEIIALNNDADDVKIFAKNKNVNFSIYDFEKDTDDLVKFAGDITNKIHDPSSLVLELPNIIKAYPKLFRAVKYDKKKIQSIFN